MGYTVAVFLLKLYLCAVCSKSPVYKRVLSQERICKTCVFVSPTKVPRDPTNAINDAVLSCERLVILVTQTGHENQTQKLENTLQHTAQDLGEYGGTEQQLAHGLASSRQARGAPDCGGWGESRRVSESGDGGQAAMSLSPDVDGMQLAFPKLAS